MRLRRCRRPRLLQVFWLDLETASRSIADCGFQIADLIVQSAILKSTIRNLLFGRVHADELALAPLLLKLHNAGHKREQRVIGTTANSRPGFELRTALPNKNRTPRYALPAESLDAESLRV